jgi:hypothetical protein
MYWEVIIIIVLFIDFDIFTTLSISKLGENQPNSRGYGKDYPDFYCAGYY